MRTNRRFAASSKYSRPLSCTSTWRRLAEMLLVLAVPQLCEERTKGQFSALVDFRRRKAHLGHPKLLRQALLELVNPLAGRWLLLLPSSQPQLDSISPLRWPWSIRQRKRSSAMTRGRELTARRLATTPMMSPSFPPFSEPASFSEAPISRTEPASRSSRRSNTLSNSAEGGEMIRRPPCESKNGQRRPRERSIREERGGAPWRSMHPPMLARHPRGRSEGSAQHE